MSGSTPSMGGLVVTHHVRVDPSRSMKSVTGDVQSLLAEYGKGSRRSCALLASELIAQIVGQGAELGGRAGWPHHSAAKGRHSHGGNGAHPGVEPSERHAPPEPLAEWGEFLLDKLADRWGVQEAPRRDIWAEVYV